MLAIINCLPIIPSYTVAKQTKDFTQPLLQHEVIMWLNSSQSQQDKVIVQNVESLFRRIWLSCEEHIFFHQLPGIWMQLLVLYQPFCIMRWFCKRHSVNKDGRVKKQEHGFLMTPLELMNQPWYFYFKI